MHLDAKVQMNFEITVIKNGEELKPFLEKYVQISKA